MDWNFLTGNSYTPTSLTGERFRRGLWASPRSSVSTTRDSPTDDATVTHTDSLKQRLASSDFYDPPYQAYQAHLSNMMNLSMLFLGFTITGTLLSVVSTGSEGWSTGEMFFFFLTAIRSCFCSITCLIISFCLAGASLERYGIFGARAGLITMYRWSFSIAIAELFMFSSMVSFIMCVKAYIGMVYRGPDICVGGLGENNNGWQFEHPSHFRPLAFCGQLGDDLFIAANTTCGGHLPLLGHNSPDSAVLELLRLDQAADWSFRQPDKEHFIMCSVFDWYFAKSLNMFEEVRSQYYNYDTSFMPPGARRDVGLASITELIQNWIFWLSTLQEGDNAPPFKSALLWQHTDEVTTAYCQRDQALELREEVCAAVTGPGKTAATTQEKVACATARQSFVVTDKCVADVQVDVLKCHKICDHDMRIWGEVDKVAVKYSLLISIFTFCCMWIRLVFNCMHAKKALGRLHELVAEDEGNDRNMNR